MLTLKKLIELQEIVKIKPLTEKAGLRYSHVTQKIKRGTELSISESLALTKALKDFFQQQGWTLHPKDED
jgi:hypothetical protein